VSGRGKMLVAPASAASARYPEPIAGLGEIVQHFARIGIVDDGSNRHWQLNRLTFLAASITAFAVPATLRGVLGIEPEVKQCVVVRAGHHRDVATTAAVAATRSAPRHVLLPTESQTPVAAIPGLYADFDFIDEHGGQEKPGL
jgi:hypothetical protein